MAAVGDDDDGAPDAAAGALAGAGADGAGDAVAGEQPVAGCECGCGYDGCG